MVKRLFPLLVVAVLAGGGYYWYSHLPQGPLVLTGIVTTNDVVVSSQVAGQIAELKIAEGDAVTKGQLLAVIAPGELQADRAYYAHSAEGLASQVRESEASLRFQQRQHEPAHGMQAKIGRDVTDLQTAAQVAIMVESRHTLR